MLLPLLSGVSNGGNYNVLPCSTTGCPSTPSQQSISMHRHPNCSTRIYPSILLSPTSCRPSRYVLWLLEMKYWLSGRVISRGLSLVDANEESEKAREFRMRFSLE